MSDKCNNVTLLRSGLIVFPSEKVPVFPELQVVLNLQTFF